jgi:hypothetical protein
LTQFLPGFDHQREALGPPFFDARLHAMQSDGVDDPRASRAPGARPAEPPPRIQNAEPRHADVWAHGGWAQDHTAQVINDGQDGQFLQHAWDRLTVPHLHRPRGLERRQRGLDVIIATHNTIDLVFHTQVYKLKREMTKKIPLQPHRSPSGRMM